METRRMIQLGKGSLNITSIPWGRSNLMSKTKELSLVPLVNKIMVCHYYHLYEQFYEANERSSSFESGTRLTFLVDRMNQKSSAIGLSLRNIPPVEGSFCMPLQRPKKRKRKGHTKIGCEFRRVFFHKPLMSVLTIDIISFYWQSSSKRTHDHDHDQDVLLSPDHRLLRWSVEKQSPWASRLWMGDLRDGLRWSR